jgi:hypothetical protein
METKKQITDRYNLLVEKYLRLRNEAYKVKDEIQQIEGLVEYENI